MQCTARTFRAAPIEPKGRHAWQWAPRLRILLLRWIRRARARARDRAEANETPIPARERTLLVRPRVRRQGATCQLGSHPRRASRRPTAVPTSIPGRRHRIPAAPRLSREGNRSAGPAPEPSSRLVDHRFESALRVRPAAHAGLRSGRGRWHCRAENWCSGALGAIKAKQKYARGRISAAAYLDATREIVSLVWRKQIEVDNVDLFTHQGQIAVEELAAKPQLDLSVALQLSRGSSSRL